MKLEKKTARVIEKAANNMRAILDSLSNDALIVTDPSYPSVKRDLDAALRGIEDMRNIVDDGHQQSERKNKTNERTRSDL